MRSVSVSPGWPFPASENPVQLKPFAVSEQEPHGVAPEQVKPAHDGKGSKHASSTSENEWLVTGVDVLLLIVTTKFTVSPGSTVAAWPESSDLRSVRAPEMLTVAEDV